MAANDYSTACTNAPKRRTLTVRLANADAAAGTNAGGWGLATDAWPAGAYTNVVSCTASLTFSNAPDGFYATTCALRLWQTEGGAAPLGAPSAFLPLSGGAASNTPAGCWYGQSRQPCRLPLPAGYGAGTGAYLLMVTAYNLGVGAGATNLNDLGGVVILELE